MTGFGTRQLANMVAVGRIGPRSARLWLRSEEPGLHRVVIRRVGSRETHVVHTRVPASAERDHTHAFTFPDDFPSATPLAPLTRYRFEIRRQRRDALVGRGRFETAPASAEDTPDRFAIAVTSCHQPFNSEGERSEDHMTLLRVADGILERARTKLLILAGDQMYADSPGRFALGRAHDAPPLHERSAAAIRRLYQERYRIFWAMPELRKLHAHYPTCPILDDHELLDNWGSRPEHASAAFRTLARGAREAYFDYQGCRVQPRTARLRASFHYDFEYGPLAGFVMDLRSQRRVQRPHNRLYGEQQLADLAAWLRRSADHAVLLLVTSVPLVHIPEWLADRGHWLLGSRVDFADQWSHAPNVPARDRLLQLLYDHQRAHPGQRLVLVGGDVHLACAFELRWTQDERPVTYQFTSSAISNRLDVFQGFLARRGPLTVPRLRIAHRRGAREARVSLVPRIRGTNPFAGLNLGLVVFERDGPRLRMRFELHSARSRGRGRRPAPTLAYRSRWRSAGGTGQDGPGSGR